METQEETSERKGKKPRKRERIYKEPKEENKKRMKIKPCSIIYENQIYYMVFIFSNRVQFHCDLLSVAQVYPSIRHGVSSEK